MILPFHFISLFSIPLSSFPGPVVHVNPCMVTYCSNSVYTLCRIQIYTLRILPSKLWRGVKSTAYHEIQLKRNKKKTLIVTFVKLQQKDQNEKRPKQGSVKKEILEYKFKKKKRERRREKKDIKKKIDEVQKTLGEVQPFVACFMTFLFFCFFFLWFFSFSFFHVPFFAFVIGSVMDSGQSWIYMAPGLLSFMLHFSTTALE